MIGRLGERDRLQRFAAGAAGGASAAVVLTGEPGSGRTTMLDALADDAARAGLAVIRGRGVEAEADLTWSGLHDVCRPLRRHMAALAAHHRQVLESALALGPPVPASTFGVAVATLQLLAAAADEQPLAVLLDDAEWLDPPTRDVVRFVARRLEAEGVLLVLAAAEVPDDLAGLEVVHLPPLDEQAVAALVAVRSGLAATPAVAAKLASGTRGNARAICELAGVLTREELLGSAPLPEPLPVGRALEAAYAAQLAWLPSSTCAALRILALSASGGRDEVVTALKAAGIDEEAFEPAIDSRLVTREDDRFVFVHPLTRAVSHASASPLQRRHAHSALASAIDAAREPERRARHLAAGTVGPDDDVADAVASAATTAFDRGAYASASALFEEAQRLSPARAGAFLVQAGEAALAAGAPGRAADLLDSALAQLTEGDTLRSRCVHLRAHAAYDSGEGDVIDTLLREAAAVEASAPELAAKLFADAALLAAAGVRVDIALDASAEAMRVADSSPRARIARGAALVVSGEVETARALLDAWREVVSGDPEPDDVRALRSVAMALIWAEEMAQAVELLEHLEVHARRHSMVGALADALLVDGIAAFSTGDWRRMEANVREAAELAAAAGQRSTEVIALANLALFEVHLGRPTAEEHLQRIARMSGGAPPRRVALMVTTARAAAASLAGRPDEAVAILDRIGAGEAKWNPAPLLWEADLADAQLDVGDRAAAAATLARFVPRAEAAGNRRSLARAAGVRAVLAEDLDEGRHHVALATSLLDEIGLPFVRARVRFQWANRLLELGERREATGVLREILEVFDALGAEPWSQRCRLLLGEHDKPVRAPVLDADERRVVDGLTRGASVADIAATTFRSAATVERQLSSAMQKLGVDSRDELQSAAQPDVVLSETVVQLLGDFHVLRGDLDLTPPPGMPSKALKVIALADGMMHVDELAEILWANAEPGRGRARLRNVLARIRAVSGDIVERRGDLLGIDAEVRVDAGLFRSLARRALAAGPTAAGRALAEEALALYTGDLLPDSVYEPWATVPRERMRVDRIALVDLLADVAESQDDLANAARLLDDAISIEPYDEHRYIRLARLLRRQQRPGAAIRVVERAERALGELGLDVSDELRREARG